MFLLFFEHISHLFFRVSIVEQVNIRRHNSNTSIDIYLFKVNNGNTRKMSEICSKLTIDTRSRSRVFVVNFEHISHIAPVLPLLNLMKYMSADTKFVLTF